jgi:hypothetical protein
MSASLRLPIGIGCIAAIGLLACSGTTNTGPGNGTGQLSSGGSQPFGGMNMGAGGAAIPGGGGAVVGPQGNGGTVPNTGTGGYLPGTGNQPGGGMPGGGGAPQGGAPPPPRVGAGGVVARRPGAARPAPAEWALAARRVLAAVRRGEETQAPQAAFRS